MSDTPITFDDGDAYERFMGRWSLLAGDVFLDWLAPAPGLRWADVGCGNGAFTELLFARARAEAVDGIDPSPAQLDFARKRLAAAAAQFRQGKADALPYPDATFDAAVMALVIFFVPVPEAGVAEMVRVTRPGGTVAAYAWDIEGGGFPTEPIAAELQAAGLERLRPPRSDVASEAALRRLWEQAGLRDVATRVIEVERQFTDFAEWWSSVRGGPTLGAQMARLAPADAARLEATLRQKMQPGPDGRIRTRARANAVRGVVPAA